LLRAFSEASSGPGTDVTPTHRQRVIHAEVTLPPSAEVLLLAPALYYARRLTMCPEIKKSINNVCAIALSDKITNTYYIFLVLAPVRTKIANFLNK
jgi:hypothetical protein